MKENHFISNQNTQTCSKNFKIKIYITILPVGQYGGEAWSLLLMEERKLRLLEDRILRQVMGPNRNENEKRRRPQ
jgi:hypothetical protein